MRGAMPEALWQVSQADRRRVQGNHSSALSLALRLCTPPWALPASDSGIVPDPVLMVAAPEKH